MRAAEQVEGAAVILSDSAREAEADAHAETKYLGGKEWLHEVIFEVVFNAWSAISDIDADLVLRRLHGDRDPAFDCMRLGDSVEGIV